MKNSEVSDRYHRQQKLISGWDQEKINGTRAMIIGKDRLSDMLLADMATLGIGRLIRVGCSDFLEFEKINPEVYLEQIDESLVSYPLAKTLIDDTDIVIDATNNMKSKYYSAIAAQDKGLKYLSVSASNTGFSLCSLPWDGTEKNIDDLLAHEYLEKEQGLTNSVIASALAIDEIRKNIFVLKNDMIMERYSNSDIHESMLIGKKILQVGAGAIGTFSALLLSLMKTELTLIDFDVVEETNLNRQFLFYDDIGKNKAEALAAKLSRHSSIKYFPDKIGEDFDPRRYGEGFDAIFCCVDNNEARYHMNLAAKKCNMPLINGGSSLFTGAAMAYFPSRTACLDCQTGGKLKESLEKEKAKRTPGECFTPSLIISNQIVGGLMIDTYIKALGNDFERTDYVAGQGIFHQKIEDNCIESMH